MESATIVAAKGTLPAIAPQAKATAKAAKVAKEAKEGKEAKVARATGKEASQPRPNGAPLATKVGICPIRAGSHTLT